MPQRPPGPEIHTADTPMSCPHHAITCTVRFANFTAATDLAAWLSHRTYILCTSGTHHRYFLGLEILLASFSQAYQMS